MKKCDVCSGKGALPFPVWMYGPWIGYVVLFLGILSPEKIFLYKCPACKGGEKEKTGEEAGS